MLWVGAPSLGFSEPGTMDHNKARAVRRLGRRISSCSVCQGRLRDRGVARPSILHSHSHI